jgi:CheY-like chemotaxis protein
MGSYAPERIAVATRTILLLDGDPDTAEMYAVGLRVFGYNIIIAEDVEDALERIRRDRPDAVVADAQAAMEKAWRLVNAVKQDPATSDVPVVVLTGRADAAICDGARSSRCAALLLKPCLPDALADILNAALTGSPVDSGPGCRSLLH